jgi:hypothetical protein
LGARRHGAHFDEPETQRAEPIQRGRILVEAGSEPHAIRETQSHAFDCRGRVQLRATSPREPQSIQRKLMRLLRLECEQR